MDQTSSLADALFKSPSLLSGLLSQLGGNSQSGLFSNLLSQDNSAAIVQTTTAQTSSAFATTTNNAPFASASLSSSSSPDTLQSLQNLASTLTNALNALRQRQNQTQTDNNNAASSSANNQNGNQPQQPVAQTTQTNGSDASAPASQPASSGSQNTAQGQSGGSDAAAAQSSNPKTASATTSTASNTAANGGSSTATSDSSAASATTATDPATQITDMIAELLMLTQLAIKVVQQTQFGGATSDAAAVQANAPTAGSNNDLAGILSATDIAQTLTKTIDALLAASGGDKGFAAAIAALSGATTDSATTTLTATAPATATAAAPTDPLTQLLNSLQENLQQSSLSGIGTPQAAIQPLPVAAATTPDIVRQFATLDAELKNILSSIQQGKSSATVAQTVSTSAQDFTAHTVLAADTSNTAKNNPADNWQSQLFAASTATPNAAPAPSSGQVFANAAAITAAAEKNTGGDTAGSDMDMNHGGGNAFSSNAASAATATPISAEGAQASGTYSFASQLSATRATNGGTVGLPSVVDQVVLQLNRTVKNGNDQMSLQLQPGDLGKITIKLDFASDGKVQGTVTADNPKTLDMLQKDSRSLERALQDAGLRADSGSLQFNLGSQQQGQNAGQSAANSGKDASSAPAGDGTDVADDNGLVDMGAIAETYYITPNGVNISV